MNIIFALLVVVVVIIIVKFLMDWIGVPKPLNWVILLLVALAAIWYAFGKHLSG
jgi:hypothetical protein